MARDKRTDRFDFEWSVSDDVINAQGFIELQKTPMMRGTEPSSGLNNEMHGMQGQLRDDYADDGAGNDGL